MKVINEKDYVYVDTKDGFHIFETNPNKLNFDKEIIWVSRARFITMSGKQKYYDYVK
jgi:outer membrane lipoprotein-sorting protein